MKAAKKEKTMSGHSKFANIKHKKEKNDAAKGKIFTIIGREIAVAVKEGGPDPANNFKLAQVIAKAKVGLYSEKSIANVPEDLKKKYFTKVGLSYQISEKVKKQVQFVQHNLIKDIYREGWHLIVCRNVLIYFTEEAKNEVFIKFYKALARRGVLFIGNTEQIINYRTIGYDRRNPFFYEKPV